MEVTFYQFGVEYLRWLDKDGNIWEAVKEQVEFFGKDFFESMPEDKMFHGKSKTLMKSLNLELTKMEMITLTNILQNILITLDFLFLKSYNFITFKSLTL